MELVRARCADFGPALAAEKLAELHALTVSRETLRKWMVEGGRFNLHRADDVDLKVRTLAGISAGESGSAPARTGDARGSRAPLRRHARSAPARPAGPRRGFKGVLVADADSVYDHLYADGTVTEAACWAHARRYFFKALTSEPEQAGEAIAIIGRLFGNERKFEGFSATKRKKKRLRRSRPVVDAFFDWCDARADAVLDDTPLAKAIGYARNQREALHTFLRDGRIPIHNNGSERELRRQAVGRKNWLFVGNDDAGERAATFVTLIASCEIGGFQGSCRMKRTQAAVAAAPSSWIAEGQCEGFRRTMGCRSQRRVWRIQRSGWRSFAAA